MIDFVIQEPKFTDNPDRCFKLPFITCETLSTDTNTIEKSLFDDSEEAKSQNNDYVLLDKIISFYKTPDPQMNSESKFLNPTLGGYINKIVSFWMTK